MKKFKLCKRILALLITGTMLSTNFNNIAAAKSERQQIVKTITKDEKKNYIVATRENNNFEKTFVDSNTVNQNEEHFLEKNDLFALELNNSEVKRLEGDSSVQYVEEDVEVEANAFYSVRHNKKVKQYKKNKSDMEWNIRMIHGEQKK